MFVYRKLFIGRISCWLVGIRRKLLKENFVFKILLMEKLRWIINKNFIEEIKMSCKISFKMVFRVVKMEMEVCLGI